jgi:hypothetical protein
MEWIQVKNCKANIDIGGIFSQAFWGIFQFIIFIDKDNAAISFIAWVITIKDSIATFN